MITGDRIEADFRPPFRSIRLELTVVCRNLNHHLTDGTIAQMCQPVRRGKILDNLAAVVENTSLHHVLNRETLVESDTTDASTYRRRNSRVPFDTVGTFVLDVRKQSRKLGLLTLAVCIKNLDEQIERIGRADVRQFIETFAVLKRFDNLKQFCILFRSKCHNFLYLNRITDFPFCAENRIESVLTSLIAWGFRSEPTTLRSLLDRLINSDIIIPLPRFRNPNTRRSAPEWSCRLRWLKLRADSNR